MAESIAARVARIVSASAHALLDAIEDAQPEAAMEQAIREVDEAIDDVRAELGRAAAAKHLASTRLAEENRKHDELAAQIDVAVGRSRDDLAEAAIARQLDIEAQIPVLETAIAEALAREKELNGFITALQAKKREMQDTLREFVASREVGGSATAPGGGDPARKVDKAQSAFDRVLQRQTGVDMAGAAVDRANAAKLAELQELARSNRIQERLAAIKAKSPK